MYNILPSLNNVRKLSYKYFVLEMVIFISSETCIKHVLCLLRWEKAILLRQANSCKETILSLIACISKIFKINIVMRMEYERIIK